ncbi:ethanolamine permease [Runella sp. MFBS21]|uniref:ethanolamine permease n=1 Tax=Runella sp. MFBS21 TaxID=3034018 RepID=UPI0023F8F7F5|nr:ethanolamine permease [Runella sp. MFBS21]MDF7816864.1 ethanolamine permease [Runella sp. MFBS21]
MSEQNHLQTSLTPTLLWGLGVGYVISGMYFGWNVGLEKGGTLGMAVATALVVIMYVCFTMGYAELACAIPKAGGVSDYATRALGKDLGFIAGIAQVCEFVLAPPAIAVGIGAHVNLFFPSIPAIYVAIGVYILFTMLNIIGVKLAATFEFFVTFLAVVGLVLFAGITMGEISFENLSRNSLPNGWAGVWGAIPFAIWFFLGIEGLANAAEESQNPQKDLTRGFGSAMLTLVILCIMTFIGSVGVGGWEAVVFKTDGTVSDSPLPLALGKLVGESATLYSLVIVFGLFGLTASFHGLLMAAGRATFEMGRIGNLPSWLGGVNPSFKTPANALIANMTFGILILLSNTAADIIVLSVLGALTLYCFGTVSVLRLRQVEPDLKRPFLVPLYPWVPLCALGLAVLALVAVVVSNGMLAVYYSGTLAIAFVLYKVFVRR